MSHAATAREASDAALEPPRAPKSVMVIFGASGDLTKRKLIPALYNLATAGHLPADFAIVGVARTEYTHDAFRKEMGAALEEFAGVEVDCARARWFMERLYYVTGAFDDAGTYQRLGAQLRDVDAAHGTAGNYFFYLATAPQFFATVVSELGKACLACEDNGVWRRVIIEKPFGRDLASAQALNRELRRVLQERQIFRIDHYLGKETVQNILVFRFGNGIFEPVWNRQYIDHVQVTAAETVGVEQRGGYYETSGALRDMVPNHLFQLITLTAMEPPVSFEADAVRDEQAKILQAIQPIREEEVLRRSVRGQYRAGQIGGQPVVGYRDEPNVSPSSTTETFVALKLCIDNWRWADVPFYLRTGKRLPARTTEIAIQFKSAPFQLFRKTPVERLTRNRLILHIQPDEGITLRFGAKVPGPVVQVGPVNMDFDYTDYFGQTPSTGYERLLYDCMCGDATLFQRADMIEAGWRIVTPMLDVWQALPPRAFPNYAAGTWGPEDADELLQRDGREWRKLD